MLAPCCLYMWHNVQVEVPDKDEEYAYNFLILCEHCILPLADLPLPKSEPVMSDSFNRGHSCDRQPTHPLVGHFPLPRRSDQTTRRNMYTVGTHHLKKGTGQLANKPVQAKVIEICPTRKRSFLSVHFLIREGPQKEREWTWTGRISRCN